MGGGGGISAQHFFYAQYWGDLINYGFFDLTFSKKMIKVELVGLDGRVSGAVNVTHRPEFVNGHRVKIAAAHASNRTKEDEEEKKEEEEVGTKKAEKVDKEETKEKKVAAAAVPAAME